jgi:hypothetical protein
MILAQCAGASSVSVPLNPVTLRRQVWGLPIRGLVESSILLPAGRRYNMSDLAVSAAQALVQAMTTSAWNEIRSKISEVFNRHKSGRRLNNELNITLSKLMADPSNRENETTRWAAIFQALASTNPDAAIDIDLIHAYLIQVISGQERLQVTQTGFAQRDQYNVHGTLTVNHG